MAQTPAFFKRIQAILAAIAVVWAAIFGLETQGITLPDFVHTIFNGYSAIASVVGMVIAQFASAEVREGKEVEPNTIK